jgi:hypothetical protein
MNPFADLDSFEEMRTAALRGRPAYEHYLRRQRSRSRRSQARRTELRLSDRTLRMLRTAVASSHAVLLVGPPGTGKTEALSKLIEEVQQDSSRFGFSRDDISEVWLTPEEEWTFDKIVLGETVIDGHIASIEGELLSAIKRDEWVILDEMNRADMDRVLGGVLTWLSGQSVKIGTWREHDEPPAAVFLEWIDAPSSTVLKPSGPSPERRYQCGSDWRLLGTYNAVDASRVFRMGQALSRRFKHVPIPPASDVDFLAIIEERFTDKAIAPSLARGIQRIYSAHNANSETSLGPALFIDIPAYIEAGLSNPASRPSARPGTPSGGVAQEGGHSSETSDSSSADSHNEGEIDTATTNSTSADVELAEELLVEGYLISVGSLMAKYDAETLEILGDMIVGAGALSDASWRWMIESLHSMRA